MKATTGIAETDISMPGSHGAPPASKSGQIASDELVLISVGHLDSELKQIAIDACERAQLRHIVWNGTSDLEGNPPINPSLLIAGLRPGDRRIPEDLARVISMVYPTLPLMVLCNEPLIRETVTLYQGRVTLLGIPLTTEVVSERIRGTLQARAQSNPAQDIGPKTPLFKTPGIGTGISTREYRRSRWWAASLSRKQDSLEVNETAGFPFVLNSATKGVVSILTPTSAQDIEPVTLERAAENFRNGLNAEQIAEALGDHSDVSAGIFLNPQATHWSIYAPSGSASLWLMSPVRLPNRWNISASIASGPSPLHRMRAAGGDLLLMYADPGGRVKSAAKDGGLLPELAAAAVNGGPALLDFLELRVKAEGPEFAAFILELR